MWLRVLISCFQPPRTVSTRSLPLSLFNPCNFQRTTANLVGLTGLEPVTLRLSSACSNQLSYKPENCFPRIRFLPFRLYQSWLYPSRFPSLFTDAGALVELRRLELLTYGLQSRRSTN